MAQLTSDDSDDSDDLAGIAGVGHDRHARRIPGLHPARQVHGVVTLLEQDARGALGTPTHAADRDDRLVLVEAADARGEGREGNVDGVGGMPGVPLVGLTDVEKDSAFVDASGGFLGPHGRHGGLALHTTKL